MLIILFSIAYSEFIWYLVKSGKRPYKNMDQMMKFMVGFNYCIAFAIGSSANFMFALICSLYQLVIFKMRFEEID